MTPPGAPAIRVAVALGLVLLQSAVLYWPSPPEVPGAGLIPFFDKLVHLGVFAVPTAALVVALPRWRVGAAAMLVQASVSEAIQGTFIPGRGADPVDLLADLAGVALGVAAGRVLGGPVQPGANLANSRERARPPSLD